MSCGRIAAERAGLTVTKYYASEIKPHAVSLSSFHYPDTKHLGDVANWQSWDIDWESIDLLIGGSPCKGISKLNKNQEGLNHKESKLFFCYFDILSHIREFNPKVKFLLENTHGQKDAVAKITELLGVEKVSINSKLVSAQNRPRYYWCSEKITPPKDLCITTKDVFSYDGPEAAACRVRWLESESGKKSVRKGFTKINPFPKSGCITANGHKKWNENYLYKDGKYFYLSISEIEKLEAKIKCTI
jgi:DNA (cytosine-5)-methyltransferase 3A